MTTIARGTSNSDIGEYPCGHYLRLGTTCGGSAAALVVDAGYKGLNNITRLLISHL